MAIVGGLDIHRRQLTFDYADTATGEVRTGRIAPADRAHLADWPRRFRGQGNVTFAVEACTGTPWSCRRRVPDTSTRPTTRARVDGVLHGASWRSDHA